jgi:hypothetical protein
VLGSNWCRATVLDPAVCCWLRHQLAQLSNPTRNEIMQIASAPSELVDHCRGLHWSPLSHTGREGRRVALCDTVPPPPTLRVGFGHCGPLLIQGNAHCACQPCHVTSTALSPVMKHGIAHCLPGCHLVCLVPPHHDCRLPAGCPGQAPT